MAIGVQGERGGSMATCRAAAAVSHLSAAQASDVIDAQVATIEEQWADVADECPLTHAEQDQLWRRQILNPGVFH